MNNGTVSRDRQVSYRQPFQRSSALTPLMAHVSEDSPPGILVFSYGRKLLHMSQRAKELTGHFDQTDIGPGTYIPLGSIQDFLVLIQQTLDQRKEAGTWGSFESNGTIFDVACKLLISGFGIANQDSYDHSRIVIVLDEIGHHKTYGSRHARTIHAVTLCSAP